MTMKTKKPRKIYVDMRDLNYKVGHFLCNELDLMNQLEIGDSIDITISKLERNKAGDNSARVASVYHQHEENVWLDNEGMKK